jgi:hypothetical protein
MNALLTALRSWHMPHYLLLRGPTCCSTAYKLHDMDDACQQTWSAFKRWQTIGYQLSISLIFDTRNPTHTLLLLLLLLLLLAPPDTVATS